MSLKFHPLPPLKYYNYSSYTLQSNILQKKKKTPPKTCFIECRTSYNSILFGENFEEVNLIYKIKMCVVQFVQNFEIMQYILYKK